METRVHNVVGAGGGRSRGLTWRIILRGSKKRSPSRRRAGLRIACWRWAPICKSLLRSRPGWVMARSAAAISARPAARISVTVISESGETFECSVDLFDAEKDRFPYADEHFSTVLCCELLEHLPTDPMFMMGEINRILKPGGHLVLSTPNLASLRALAGILQGFNPQLFSAYIRPRNGVVDARHAREYTPYEMRKLLEDSGFEVALLETGPFREELKPEFGWVEHLLTGTCFRREHRGEGIYAVGRKVGPVRHRYPSWLYS